MPGFHQPGLLTSLAFQDDLDHLARWPASEVGDFFEVDQGIISISQGKCEGRPEGAKRPPAGDEPREFTSRGEGGRVPPFFEKLRTKVERRLNDKSTDLHAGSGGDRLIGV